MPPFPNSEPSSDQVPPVDYVIDTSALVAFSGIQRLDLLRACCGRVGVPTAVRVEVIDQGIGWVKAAEAQKEILRGEWIRTLPVTDSEMLYNFRKRLGAGEAECLELGRFFGITVIVDDQRARKEGERLGVQIIGSLGILAKSKRIGLIDLASPLIEKIRQNGIFLSNQQVADFLTELGEIS